MTLSSLLFIIISFLGVRNTNAANDWTTPCLNGTCQYSLPSTAASGSIKIWGSDNAISDITTAAGWEILDCSPDTMAQSIRLVCANNTTASGCDHLYQNTGAEGKIVRLPENCGQMPFAHVAKAWVSDDQSIPARLRRRDGSQQEVKALSLDMNFGNVDPTKLGDVNIAIQGVNVPGLDSDIPNLSISSRSRIFRRGLLDGIINGIKNLDGFNISKNDALPPIDIDQTFNLVNASIDCGDVKAAVNADVDAKAHALATIGFAAAGTIVPPQLTAFGITGSITADLNGTLDLNADVLGTLDSGKIQLFEIGLPGLDFPGIFTLGPSFQINAQVIAQLDIDINMTVGLNYQISKADFTFPPSSYPTTGDFELEDTPLHLSLSPSANATGSIEAHLIPTLNLGISALGIANANVFLDLDTSAKLELTLQAAARNITAREYNHRSAPRDTKARRAPYYSDYSFSTSSSAPPPIYSTPNPASSSTSSASSSTSSAALSSYSSTPNENTTFGGCVELLAGLDVNVGADADLFGLFDINKQLSLFSKEFQLFQKCFGNAPQSRRSWSRWISGRRSRIARDISSDLVCPGANVTSAISVVDQLISAAGVSVV